MQSKYVILFQILSLILINVDQLKAACNLCTANTQMACVSETEYQFCVNNIPSGTSASCPTGYICSTATNVICIPNVAGTVPSCNSCNKCNSSLVFACTGINTYALCLGQNLASTTINTCPNGLVCNINSPQICSNSSVTPTCPTTGTITPTTATTTTSTVLPTTVPTYAQYFCNIMRQNKRFSIPSGFGNTCKNYIYCFLTTQGIWSGQIYTCPGSTYFNPVTLYCGVNRPTGC